MDSAMVAIGILISNFIFLVKESSLILDGLWTARKVKIDLSSIKDVSKVKYSRFFFNRAVYNLHLKGAIHFFGYPVVSVSKIKYILSKINKCLI